jgi:hypothetical protein
MVDFPVGKTTIALNKPRCATSFSEVEIAESPHSGWLDGYDF